MDMRPITIMRGLPGSGKSTWVANNRKEAVAADAVCSADNFLIDNGKYIWSPERLEPAHFACKAKFRNLLINKAEHIVVDNTNLRIRDMGGYISMATDHKRDFEIVIIDTPVETCICRQTHGVPKEAFEKLAARFNERLPDDWEAKSKRVFWLDIENAYEYSLSFKGTK